MTIEDHLEQMKFASEADIQAHQLELAQQGNPVGRCLPGRTKAQADAWVDFYQRFWRSAEGEAHLARLARYGTLMRVEEIVTTGYWRRHFHTVREDYVQANAHSKDAINIAVKAAQKAQGDPKAVRTRMEQENADTGQKALEWARSVVETALPGLAGMTPSQIEAAYRV